MIELIKSPVGTVCWGKPGNRLRFDITLDINGLFVVDVGEDDNLAGKTLEELEKAVERYFQSKNKNYLHKKYWNRRGYLFLVQYAVEGCWFGVEEGFIRGIIKNLDGSITYLFSDVKTPKEIVELTDKREHSTPFAFIPLESMEKDWITTYETTRKEYEKKLKDVDNTIQEMYRFKYGIRRELAQFDVKSAHEVFEKADEKGKLLSPVRNLFKRR